MSRAARAGCPVRRDRCFWPGNSTGGVVGCKQCGLWSVDVVVVVVWFELSLLLLLADISSNSLMKQINKISLAEFGGQRTRSAFVC